MGIVLSWAAAEVQARPYATCITNTGTAISFRLNESADNVRIISSAGAVTNNLGALPKGLNTANVAVSGVFKIQVTKSAGPGWMQGIPNQISEDTNRFVKFTNERGLAVNKNTNSPYFGRIYVSISSSGTVASNEFNLGSRAVADGIYVLNPDQTDALGQGDTPRTGGLKFDFYGANSESPGYLAIAHDDTLFISDWSDINGGVWTTDANVATNAAASLALIGPGGPTAETNIHGSVSGVWAEGSKANNDLVLYTADEDLDPGNGLWSYAIGNTPMPFTSPGTQLFTFGLPAQRSKIVHGPNGYWYCSNRRADNASSSGLIVLGSDGTPLWFSLAEWRNFTGNGSAYDSQFSETRGLDVTSDGKFVATFKALTNLAAAPYNLGPNTALILPLQDGVPVMSRLIAMKTTPGTGTGWDLSFDAVGNMYTLSTGQGLRVYSPGGFSVVTTGSDGSLDVFVPQVDISVAVNDADASENGPDPAEFLISRAAVDVSQPLAVKISMSGTATQGSDYVLQTNGVTLTTNVVIIPAGLNDVTVRLLPIDDSVAELTETAILGIGASAEYTVATGAGTANITDNETPSIEISVVQGQMFEGNPNDYVTLRLTRKGDLVYGGGTLTVNITYSGEAASGTDFTPVDTVDIASGEVTHDFQVSPINDALLETNETFKATVAAGSGYTVGAANVSGALTIIDDETPAVPVLLSDNLSGDSSVNWTIKFGSGNGIDDYRINEQALTFPTTPYDYSADGVPAAPNGSDTLGLKVTVNKDEGTAAGGAGVNLYRNGQTFSGNYALRFDMYLLVNAGAGTTENAIFGINHSGDKTNWFRASGNGYTNSSYDGVWCLIGADGAALGQFNGGTGSGDYELLGGGPAVQVGGIWGPPTLAFRNSSSFAGVFKTPPWGSAASTGAGVPSNMQSSGTPSWAQVELSQIGNLITLKINNSTIMTYTNTTGDKSGKIMLGFDDAFDSNTGTGGAVIYDNVRVVSLGRPEITKFNKSGTTLTMDFTWTLNDAPATFAVQKATDVAGAYSGTAATIVQTGPGTYRATVSGETANAAFYRISR